MLLRRVALILCCMLWWPGAGPVLAEAARGGGPAPRPGVHAPRPMAQAQRPAGKPQAARSRPAASRAPVRAVRPTARPPAPAGAAARAAPIAVPAGAAVARQGVPPLGGPFLPAPAPSGEPGRCEAPPSPVRNLESTGFYMDPAFSRPDLTRMRADGEAARPLRDWLALVQRAVARHRAGEAGAAACALEALDQWAKNDALLGAFNLQGGYHRKMALSGAALSFLAIRDAPGLDAVRLGRTARWLGAVAEAVRPHYDRKSVAIISDIRNHEAAWAGLAVAAAGIANRDRAQLDWGIARLRAQLAQVDERGVLPQEAKRGAMALRYHLLAFDAVAALERLASANGIALTDGERAAYGRLRDLCLAAARDPLRMEAIAEAAQSDIWVGEGGPLAEADGLEIAAAAAPDALLEEALAPSRPFSSPWLGGVVTGWWKGGAAGAPPLTPTARDGP